MKLPIVVGGCLVVGLGLGTFLGKKPAAADPATTPKAEAPAPPASPTAMPIAPAPDTSRPAPIDTTAPAISNAAPALDTAHMAATLSKLPAADAAPLVAGLSDNAVEAVLRKMDVTHASAVIAAMPKERGQLMSKRLLASGTK